MYLNRRELLTPNQRNILMRISDNITENELSYYYTLSFEDLDIINIHRLNHNKLGFALQLSILRHSGWSLIDFKKIPTKIIKYVASQLDIDSDSFYKYFNRKNTKYEHLESICKLFNYKKYNKHTKEFLFNELLQIAKEENNSFKLVNDALNILRKNKIIIPSIRTIEQVAWRVKDKIQNYIFNIIHESLTITQKHLMDNLIIVQSGETKTKLSWLREIPGKSSSKTFNEIADRIEYIRSLKLENIDLSSIHNNRIEDLYKLGSNYEAYDFKRFNEKKDILYFLYI